MCISAKQLSWPFKRHAFIMFSLNIYLQDRVKFSPANRVSEPLPLGATIFVFLWTAFVKKVSTLCKFDASLTSISACRQLVKKH